MLTAHPPLAGGGAGLITRKELPAGAQAAPTMTMTVPTAARAVVARPAEHEGPGGAGGLRGAVPPGGRSSCSTSDARREVRSPVRATLRGR